MAFCYTVEFGDHGLPYIEPEHGAQLHIRPSGDGVVIMGNPAGLLHLAKHLIALAEFDGRPGSGFHFHLDPGRRLDDESTPVSIYKLPLGS